MTGSTLGPNGFRTLGFRAIYVSGQHDLSRDFFIPMLSHAIAYDRGVGYFSSGWLKVNAQGLARLAERGGKARWVTSPILSSKDMDAFNRISEQEQGEILADDLLRTVSDLENALERDTRNTMAWMVADGLLEFKFAIPTGKLDGDFHDKFGIFRDPFGQRVSFLGSYNDTVKGLRNYESIRVFFSWMPGLDDSVVEDEARFARIWSGKEPSLIVHSLPEAVREGILRLRDDDRPYPKPLDIAEDPISVSLPGVVPREYQNEAIEKWVQNNYRGILDMATGTGKTMTAILAITACPSPGFIVIGAPTSALVKQWLNELQKIIGIRTPIEISGDNPGWSESLIPRLRVASSGNASDAPFVFVGTYASFSGDRFLTIMENLPIADATGWLIADEVHNTGSSKHRKLLLPHFSYRLGLTATLERPHDEEGTEYVETYFDKVIYKLGIEQVVGSVLCEYRYDVFFAELTEEEYEEYQQLSKKIAVLMGGSQTKAERSGQLNSLDFLLNKRANIVKQANEKFIALEEIFDTNETKKSLIYCADLEQLAVVRDILSCRNILNLQFTGREDSYQRQVALGQLGRGDIQAIVAIKCLDEGIDVPQVNQAILLASSTSEREFVQRRGRILRRAPGKQFAHLFDIFTVPPMQYYEVPPSLLFSELKRARILAKAAVNRHEVDLKLVEALQSYGIPIEQVLGEENAVKTQ